MSRDIWVISDTHLGHENMLKFKNRNTDKLVRGDQFDNVDQMDDYMLEKWNSVVKQGDIVYHLGDVFMGSKERFTSNWPKFKGSKRLIVGNHDDIKFLSSGGFFKKVQMWRMFPEFGLLLSRVPLHESSLWRGKDDVKQIRNVHGHIHENPSPDGPYKCVCVEQIDYTPVNIEELRIL